MASIAKNPFAGLSYVSVFTIILLGNAAFLLLSNFIQQLRIRHKRPRLPVVGTSSGDENFENALNNGLAKYHDTPFMLSTSPPLVIMPISLLNELRNLPESQASFTDEIYRMFVGKHTGIGEKSVAAVQAVKIDLTRHIANTLGGLQDEIKYALDKELGPCEEWTPFVLYNKLTQIVALLSGRVFVGRPLSREQEWIDSSIQYTGDCVKAREAILKYPVFLRGFVAPFLPEIRRIKQQRLRAGKLLQPMITATMARARNEKTYLDDMEDEQATFISWILNRTEDKSRANPTVLGNNQLVLSFAAIHTTTMATCHAIFDMVSRPEYIKPLREEIEKVINEDGQDLDGEGFKTLKKSSITKLKKLDSFLKESQRLSPPGLVSMFRITTSPLTLSTGHTLPTGTRFAFPSYAVHTSPDTLTYSPDYNPPFAKAPTSFDGFRFYNLRAMEGKENMHQFVTTSCESLNFGHGNHACPGRFFASNEIKVVLIELLRSWEFRLKGDVEGKGGEDKRPMNFVVELGVTPNIFAEIEFRRRRE